MALLQVLISTFGKEGLARVGKMSLPELANVEYLVSCQCEPTELPKTLLRPDVDVRFSSTSGLSVNRNIAIALASAPYALIADDDIEYDKNGLSKIIEAFEENKGIDVATFIVTQPFGGSYPPAKHNLWKYFRNYMPYSPEIAFRTKSINKTGLSFNESFGVGVSDMPCGEEDIFLLQAKNNGLKGMFFPIKIGTHKGVTTGYRLQSNPGVLKAQGAVIALKHPFTFPLRIPLKALRTKSNFFKNLYHLLRGAGYALNRPHLFFSNN
ncbi:MAG: glycosyltransferase [Clostridium sp.]|nr:glycosyltransferase [Clostridium sp.]